MDNINSTDFTRKKQFYQNLLTIYGRKPILESLQDESIDVFKVHLATSNKKAAILNDIIKLCKKRQVEICYHEKKALSRISKNSKQDQGIAADLRCPGYQDYQYLLEGGSENFELLALDSITNPQNLGMIIRSVCASGIKGILLPRKGCASLDPLVIKASVGTLFNTKIFRCDDLSQALQELKLRECNVYALSSHANTSLGEISLTGKNIFVLGNESNGVSASVMRQCNEVVSIKMHNGVESLNVAITAALIAFRGSL